MNAAFLIPNEGLMVRDPKTKTPLSQKGETKPMGGSEGRYWRRRIRDGAVKIGKFKKKVKTIKHIKQKKEEN